MKIYRIKCIFVALSILFVSSGVCYADKDSPHGNFKPKPPKKVSNIDPHDYNSIDHDHFEAFNRPVFEFNNLFDKLILLPMALIYRDFVPDSFKVPIEGVVGQLQYPISAVNHTLQGDYNQSLLAIKKLSVNLILTMGTGHIPLEEEKNQPFRPATFNQSLKQQGVNAHYYLVLPFVGGKPIRKHIGDFVDSLVIGPPSEIRLMPAVVARARYIDVLQTLEDTSLDYYAAIRNIVMQTENNTNYSREPKTEFKEFDFSEEELD